MLQCIASYGGDVISNARPAQAAGGRCPYLASGSQAAATTRDMILAHPIDIEELAKLGTAWWGQKSVANLLQCAVCTVPCRLPCFPWLAAAALHGR